MSYWYGARSRQEIFYQEYFEGLAAKFSEFPLPSGAVVAAAGGQLDRSSGFIHEVVLEQYLDATRTSGPWSFISAVRRR